jgi:competence protein ComEC
MVSMIYGFYKSKPYAFPYGKSLTARFKVLTDPKVRRKTFQLTGRLMEIKIEGETLLYPGSQRVLLNIPIMGAMIERGSSIECRGIFLDLPHESSPRYAGYLKSNNIAAIFEVYPHRVDVLKRSRALSFLSAIKRKMEGVNDRLLPWPHSEFATALFTGNRDGLPEGLNEAFQRSGTMHILAVSGLHIGFIVFFVLMVLKLFPLRRVVRSLLLIGIVTLYMIFIGDSASVRRASVMVICGITGFIFDRDRNYLNVLAIAFCVLWLVNPLLIMNPGFLLSFTATFAILFFVPHIFHYLNSVMPKFLAASFSVSLGVQAYLFPVLLSFFGSFPYINIFANLFIVPLAGISLALEIFSLLLYPVFLPLAIIGAEVNTVVITTIIRLTGLFAKAPPLTAAGFPIHLIPLYLSALTFGLWLLIRKKDRDESAGLYFKTPSD